MEEIEELGIRFRNKRDIELVKWIKENFPLVFHTKTNTDLARVCFFFIRIYLTDTSVGGLTMREHLMEVLDRHNVSHDDLRRSFHEQLEQFMEYGLDYEKKDKKPLKWDNE